MWSCSRATGLGPTLESGVAKRRSNLKYRFFQTRGETKKEKEDEKKKQEKKKKGKEKEKEKVKWEKENKKITEEGSGEQQANQNPLVEL